MMNTTAFSRWEDGAIDLFKEDLVAKTGMEKHIPDLLWGATPEDLRGAHPLAVYFYDWNEIDRETYYKARLEGKQPLINLDSRGLYIGTKREQEDIKSFDLTDVLCLTQKETSGLGSAVSG